MSDGTQQPTPAGGPAKAEPAVVEPLRRWLPEGLAVEVDAAVEQWGNGGKVARLWEGDATVWTGKGEEHWLGWLGIAGEQLKTRERFSELVEDVRPERFKDAVVLGMGGSSLCPEVLALTFSSQSEGLPRLRVLDSTDPQQIAALQKQLDLRRTLFVVSSKSGTTLEPNIFAAYFHALVLDLIGAAEAGSRFVAITDPGSPLEQHAEREGYRGVFHGLASIGGRYSALSDFGMVPGAIGGVDVVSLLDNARRMMRACAPDVPAADNPGLVLGAVIGACATLGRDKLTIIATEGIRDFGAWLEQLLAESTGKQGKGVIPVDREPLGTPGVYGSDRLFVYLRLASDHDEQQDARLAALREAGHPVAQIDVDSVYELGGEIFRWEFATAVAGAIIGIDPFNQPDVEDAKVAARELTDAYEREGSLPEIQPFYEGEGFELFADEHNATEIRRDAGQGDSLDSLLHAHLSRAHAGDYIALLAYLPMSHESESMLSEIRVLLRDRLGVATCVGFGPRFQHSTGQAYKGGPGSGVFLQITCRDAVDLEIPGHSYTFGTVKEAQARSDFDALAKRGRRALRVHLPGTGAEGLRTLHEAVARALG